MVVCAFVGSVAAPPAAHADMVITWMNLADHAFAKAWDEDPRGFRTEKTARAGAQVSLAVVEAVNSVDRRYTSYLSLAAAEAGASADAPDGADEAAGVAAAA